MVSVYVVVRWFRSGSGWMRLLRCGDGVQIPQKTTEGRSQRVSGVSCESWLQAVC